MSKRRIRHRLSIGEIDAIWLNTATNSLYRFHDGHWQCSRNVYYGKDDGFFNFPSEPTAGTDWVFIEMPQGQDVTDPVFAEIMSNFGAHDDSE